MVASSTFLPLFPSSAWRYCPIHGTGHCETVRPYFSKLEVSDIILARVAIAISSRVAGWWEAGEGKRVHPEAKQGWHLVIVAIVGMVVHGSRVCIFLYLRRKVSGAYSRAAPCLS